jgi:serine/threonine protein kinase
MDKYEILKAVGDGSFGSVTKARNKTTNEIVAIKRMKATFASWDEAMKLREVKSLRKLNHHNIVKLKEVIRQKDSLYFVFEFMENNLYEVISKNVSAPTESEIKLMTMDSLHGIAACHKSGYFHRDLKPENLLINNQNIVKLADFGLAREIRARPPFTEYVSTRWYRAPELLLSSTNYNSPIDIFAMGCILAEMYLLRPLAPGNSEAD